MSALTGALTLSRIAGVLLTPARLTPIGAGLSLAALAYGAYDTYRNNTSDSPRLPTPTTPQPVPASTPASSNPRLDPNAKVGEGRYTPPSTPVTPEQVQKELSKKAAEASGADSSAGANAGAGAGASNANDLLQALKDIANNGSTASAALAVISGALINFPKLIEAVKTSSPTITIPDISIPEIKVPEIDFAPVAAAIKALELPKIEIPDISVPALDLAPVGAAITSLGNLFPAKELIDNVNTAKIESLEWAKTPVSVHAVDGAPAVAIAPREAAVAKDVAKELTARELNNFRPEDSDFSFDNVLDLFEHIDYVGVYDLIKNATSSFSAGDFSDNFTLSDSYHPTTLLKVLL